MAKISTLISRDDDEHIELPPGFRFHPSDEELITHYLSEKVLDSGFCARAVGEVDFNRVEPWDLPCRAKMGEKEWYFFCVRDRKYPTGMRTNRATDAGYWKATGKDREIYRGKSLVGMKKTLVFYKGRAPKGAKTNWVMHEYRLEGKASLYNLPDTAKNEWVICRIFEKNSADQKINVSGLATTTSPGDDMEPFSDLPPLTDCSAFAHVTCFSDQLDDIKPHDRTVNILNKSPLLAPSSSSSMPSDISPVSWLFQDSIFNTQFVPNIEKFQFTDCFLLQNNGPYMKRDSNEEFSPEEAGMSTDISSVVTNYEMGQRSFEDQVDQINSAGPVDLDCLWSH